jgi:hypothetical protein
MAQPKAPREPLAMDDKSPSPTKGSDQQVERESAAQYRNSIDKINRSQDRDIERALSR